MSECVCVCVKPRSKGHQPTLFYSALFRLILPACTVAGGHGVRSETMSNEATWRAGSESCSLSCTCQFLNHFNSILVQTFC